MTTPTSTPPSADGVYFDRADRAGFGRRLLSGVVDGLVLVAFWFGLAFAWVATYPRLGIPAEGFVAAWMLGVYIYLAPVKRSRLRTLGYRAAGIKVVDLRGRPPSLVAMTIRAGLLMQGLPMLLVDLLWMLGNADRRKLTDLLAGTSVVRVMARPVGRGVVVPAISCAGSHFWVYEEVRRAAHA